jgi:beta-mannosidase
MDDRSGRAPLTIGGAASRRVCDRWQLARLPAGSVPGAADQHALAWLPARVPGTVASAFASAGVPPPQDLDESEWWFKTVVDVGSAAAGERLVLCFEGIATVWEVLLDGEPVAGGQSMFRRAEVDVTSRAGKKVELLLRCRPLADGLRRSRPRARWRTRIAPSTLRWHRTTLLGRAPGFAPGPAPVGPWREVRLDHRRVLEVSTPRLRTSLVDGDGELRVQLVGRWLGVPHPLAILLDGPSGHHSMNLDVVTKGDDFHATGRLVVPQAAPWMPHTHGTPHLHDVRLNVGDHEISLGHVGFRDVRPGPEPGHDIEHHGLQLHVNDQSMFVRGFLWSALDAVSLGDDRADLRRTLTLARDAGANMIRIPGTTVYPSDLFYDVCDELGILVWQDLMFANFDYPFDDPDFLALVTEEIEFHVDRFASRPSLAVVCGGSEVAQQAAMFGVDAAHATVPFLDEGVPALLTRLDYRAVYLPSSPWGGVLPFRFDRGVAHYFGVGGYRRPVHDVRLTDVRFASECLAFANVPEPEAFDDILPGAPGDVVVTHPRWKAGVPRDAGAGWDFDDVRDHYLQELYGIDPLALRSVDHSRYMCLSRRVSGEVMSEVLGQWRRHDSTCAGALVLWLRDLVPGAGWGVLDSAGRPKAAYHIVKRLLAPVSVWTTDEALAGLRVHVANDGPSSLTGTLRIGLYCDASTLIEHAEIAIELPAHGSTGRDVEELLGRFVDASGAYGFGPPSHDLVVASLYDDLGMRRSQHLRFLHGHPSIAKPNEQMGMNALPCSAPGHAVGLKLSTRSAAIGVRARMPGFVVDEDVFDIGPGDEVQVVFDACDPCAALGYAEISADNLAEVVRVDCRNAEPESRADSS